jgi:VWFA-related protein
MEFARRLAALAASLWCAAGCCDSQILGGQPLQPKAVTLSVVAMDGKGQPVTDLTEKDFQITDAGKAQQLAIFRHREAKLQQAAPLRPGEFSNRAAANVPNATLILFDLLNESFSARGAAQAALVRGLQSLETSDYLYLYILTLDNRIYPVRPLPGAETEAPPAGGVPWTRDSKAIMDQAIAKVFRLRMTEIDIDTRIRMTYRSLENVASMMAGIPGRKNIVWITHGVPITLGPQATFSGDGIDYTPLLKRLSLALNRIGVAIYPVQQVPPGMAMEGTPEARTSGIGSEDTLQQFADLTGGTMKAGSDIGNAVRQAMNDVRTSYFLGYYPPQENWDGKFHKLRLSCARKGVKLQAKTGYYAWEETGSSEQDAFEDAMVSSFDAAEIGVRGLVSSDGANAKTKRFDFRIDGSDVRMGQQGDRYTGHLALELAAFTNDGKTAASKVVPLDLNLTGEEHAKALKEGIAFPEEVNLENNIQKVRLMVFDRETHAVGSLTIPLAK